MTVVSKRGEAMRRMRRKVGLLLHNAVKRGHFKHHKGSAVSGVVGGGGGTAQHELE